MAGRYTKIPTDTFDGLGLDAGVLLKNFNIEAAISGEDGFLDEDIITATTGGVNPVATPTFSDLGEDVDNVPVNMKELMHLDSWAASLSTTAYDTSPETVKLALGCADIDGNKITPRASLNQSDFGDIWWVGDKANGGFIAVHLLNALSVEGFSLQSTKNGKVTFPLTFNGHVSINAQDVVPIEIYSVDVEKEPVTYIYTAVTPIGTENPKEEGWYVLVGDAYRITSDTEVDSNVTYYGRTEG